MEPDTPRERWLAERRTGIGGSDAAAVLGLSPWRSSFDVWLEKIGEAPPNKGNEAMWWGSALESLIARRYAETKSRTIWNPERLYRHPDHNILIATPDRMVLNRADAVPRLAAIERGLEVKTASAYATEDWGEEGTDAIPTHYLVQCVHYMMVTGYERWDVAALLGGSDFRVYTIQRDRELEDRIRERLLAWWERHVVGGERPPLQGEGADRWVRERFPKETLAVAPADSEAAKWSRRLREARYQIETAEVDKLEAENNLKNIIADRAGLEGDDWRVTWKKAKDSNIVDWRAVAVQLANDLALRSDPATWTLPGSAAKHAATLLDEAAEQHTEVRPGSRRFLFKFK